MASSSRTRGRRPGASQTREAIIRAARQQFGQLGYQRTTLRSVAQAAGVDHRLVLHYFGSKQQLFIGSVELPMDPEVLLAGVFGADETAGSGSADRQRIGQRVAEALMAVLEDRSTRAVALGLIRAAASEPEAAELIREVLTERVLLPFTRRVGGDHPRLRASLAASQFVGIAMARHVVGIEPLASLPAGAVVRAIGPVFEHYLFGDWTEAVAADQPTGGPSS